ncbi:hypothetical protein Lesp02_01850 [Lentzea sp. NBRC 105346]|uniref:PPE domain-containing protein n=1 Tax=Lentzea sp. NBRC 105346 TaxID=3032205 RepID=UPI0024A60AB8|nr:hypothetical protein [Lentzea sp. NBRC 105346]GLZ27995.1 hypothetical protein Lesp02_01850 [Lentzea sp. NBRC 105346]
MSYDWAAVSHHDLYRAVHERNDPGEVGQISAEWTVLSGELVEAARLIREAVTAAESGWEGRVADVARLAMRELSEWTTELAETVTVVAHQVDEQGRIMAEARAAMPEPVDFSYAEMTKPFSSGAIQELTESTEDIRLVRDQSLSCHEQAVAVMREMEEKSRALDRVRPEFSLPRNPLTGREQEPVALVVTGDRTSRPRLTRPGPHPVPAGPAPVPVKAFAAMSGDLGLPPANPSGERVVSAAVEQQGPVPRTTSGPSHGGGVPPFVAEPAMPMMPMTPATPVTGGHQPPEARRQARFVLAEDFFAAPGGELAPPVIGDEQEAS